MSIKSIGGSGHSSAIIQRAMNNNKKGKTLKVVTQDDSSSSKSKIKSSDNKEDNQAIFDALSKELFEIPKSEGKDCDQILKEISEDKTNDKLNKFKQFLSLFSQNKNLLKVQ